MENACLLNRCFRCKYKGWVRSMFHGFLKTTKQKIDLLQKIKNKKQLISNFKLFFCEKGAPTTAYRMYQNGCQIA